MAEQPTPTVHIPLNISYQSVYLGTPELLLYIIPNPGLRHEYWAELFCRNAIKYLIVGNELNRPFTIELSFMKSISLLKYLAVTSKTANGVCGLVGPMTEGTYSSLELLSCHSPEWHTICLRQWGMPEV